jgi:hypothetical protein
VNGHSGTGVVAISKTNLPGKEIGKIVELYLDSVFWFGIGWYFLGILPTDTEGKLGKDFLLL